MIKILPVQRLTWEISFDMVLHRDVGEYHNNIFHFTTGGSGIAIGDRIPALWVKNQLIHFTFVTDTNPNYIFEHDVTINQKISIKMEQVLVAEQPTVRIFVDQQVVFNMSHNWKTPFHNVKLYLGNPWFEPGPVTIFDFKYRSE